MEDETTQVSADAPADERPFVVYEEELDELADLMEGASKALPEDVFAAFEEGLLEGLDAGRKQYEAELEQARKGGFFGHAGRPGKRGGSQPKNQGGGSGGMSRSRALLNPQSANERADSMRARAIGAAIGALIGGLGGSAVAGVGAAAGAAGGAAAGRAVGGAVDTVRRYRRRRRQGTDTRTPGKVARAAVGAADLANSLKAQDDEPCYGRDFLKQRAERAAVQRAAATLGCTDDEDEEESDA